VQASRDRYYATGHPCACPGDLMHNSQRCGGRSAHSRPGGAAPRLPTGAECDGHTAGAACDHDRAPAIDDALSTGCLSTANHTSKGQQPAAYRLCVLSPYNPPRCTAVRSARLGSRSLWAASAGNSDAEQPLKALPIQPAQCRRPLLSML
jgi:hypothetical protein